MNVHVTGPLRNAFDEIADSAPPPAGLAPSALRRARRDRRARMAGSGVIAAICAGIIGVAALAAPGGNNAPIEVGNPAERKPVVVAAYSGIRDHQVEDGSPAFNYSLLLNQKTGEYERVAYRFVMPSPDGKRVLVGKGDNSARYPSQVGVMDRATGDVRWIDNVGTGYSNFPGYASDGQWSPDGKRILFGYYPRAGKSGFVLVDSDSLETRVVDLPELANAELTTISSPMWLPDSNGFAVTKAHLVEGQNVPDVVTGIRFYDLTGRMIREVPANAALKSQAAYSPDGSLMALSSLNWDGPREIQLADSDTGAVRQTVKLAELGELVGWADQEHLVVKMDGDQPRLVVVNLAGEQTSTIDLPRAAHETMSMDVFLG